MQRVILSKTFLRCYVGRNPSRMKLLWKWRCWPCRYVQPRGYFQLEDHRFDKLPMVGEGQWEDALNALDDNAPVTNVPMTQIVRN